METSSDPPRPVPPVESRGTPGPSDPSSQRRRWSVGDWVGVTGIMCVGVYLVYDAADELYAMVLRSLSVWRAWYMLLAPLFGAIFAWRVRRAIQRSSISGRLRAARRLTVEAFAAALVVPALFSGLWPSAVVWWNLFAGQPTPVLIAMLLPHGVMLAVLLIAACWLTLLSARRRVFISFHNSLEVLAERVAQSLARAGLTVRRIPFDPNRTHDHLLQSILGELRRCDVVVCLPGPRASFVEHEILAASILQKMIVFVVGGTSARLPNTALYGYPVFRLHRLERRNFQPLTDLVLLGIGGWRATLRHLASIGGRATLGRRSSGFSGAFPSFEVSLVAAAFYVLAPYLVGSVAAGLNAGFPGAWEFVTTLHERTGELLTWNIRWWGFVVYMALAGCAALLANQIRTRRVLKQQILTGRSTRQSLRALLGASTFGMRIIAALWPESPLAEHESDSTTVRSEGRTDTQPGYAGVAEIR